MSVDMSATTDARYCTSCPTCGALIPGEDVALMMVGRQRRMFEIVRRAGTVGISARDLISVAYDDDPNGGPASATIVSSTIRAINQKIYLRDLVIRGKRGPHGRYCLFRLR